MALWRENGFADDVWTRVADDEPTPEIGAILVVSALAARAGGARRAQGVCRGRDRRRQGRLDDLGKAAARPLVALKFDKFADGRASPTRAERTLRFAGDCARSATCCSTKSP